MFGRKLPRRFYENVNVVKSLLGFTVELDGRAIKTPAKNLLEVNVEPVARLIAAEWAQQGDFIDLEAMHTTKIVNTAIDHISANAEDVITQMAEFASSDLLCYRAHEPDGLVSCQNASWDPVLEWLDKSLGARLLCVAGIVHQAQPEAAIGILAANLRERPALMLAAMHNITTLTGSAVLAFAVADGHLDAQKAWDCAHVDEDWQNEQWGRDEDAAAHRARRLAEMKQSAELLALL